MVIEESSNYKKDYRKIIIKNINVCDIILIYQRDK